MEDQLTAKGNPLDLFTSEGRITKEAPMDLQAAMKLNLNRHVSLLYGVEFRSKVELFAKQHSQNTTITNLENIPKEELYRKVLCFLQLAVQNDVLFQSFIKTFKLLDKEMQLSIKKSTTSIHSHISSASFGSGSDIDSTQKVKEALMEMTNSCYPPSAGQEPNQRKPKTSMCKDNRISVGEAVNISQLLKLAQKDPIQSIGSLESKPALKGFKSNKRISLEVSQNTESNQDIKGNKTERKKISIMVQDLAVGSMASQWFSEEDTCLSLSQIKLPRLTLNEMMLEVFFDPPSPYLVNLALCLFCKCLCRGQIALEADSVGWLLGVSTIVAYKLYYDETIQGLIQFFCEGMKMQLPDLIKLQRWFLSSLNYQAAVSSQQYQNMLVRLMSS